MSTVTTRSLAFLSALLVAWAFPSCTSERAVAPDDVPVDVLRPLSAEARFASVQGAGLGHLKEQWKRVSWVGDLHAQQMADLVANRDGYLRGPGHRTTKICRASFRLVLKYHTRTYELGGLPVPGRGEAIREVEEAVRRTPPCSDFRAPRSLSIFEPRTFSAPLPVVATTTLADTLVDGSFVPYVEELSNRWNADGNNDTYQEALAIVSSVLSSAEGIHSGDYQVVLAVADGLLSSASSWESDPLAQEPCNPNDPGQSFYCMPAPESLFVPGWKKAFYVVGADVIGGAFGSLAGAAMGSMGGGIGVLAGAVVGGSLEFAAGSSAAALSLLLVE